MSRPRISVVIPTYQRNDLLAKCLAALAPGTQHTVGDYEVIVTDDGRTNTAEQLVHEQFPWAIWTQGPQRGPAANRNHGASLAQADWLAFTDDDCIPRPGWLKALLTATASGHSVYEGRTTTDLPIKGPRWQAPVNESGGYLWSCNLLLTRELFNQLDGFDEAFPYPHQEDVDLRIRIKQLGQSWSFVPEAEVFHPQRPAIPWHKRARAQQSGVYLCHKHGQPLSFANIDPLSSLRAIKRTLLGPGSAWDKFTFLCGILAEQCYLLVKVPYWKSQYNKR